MTKWVKASIEHVKQSGKFRKWHHFDLMTTPVLYPDITISKISDSIQSYIIIMIFIIYITQSYLESEYKYM